ncbi:MAG: PEP-CTERM sorting domain-containing protein [Planctomycetota bacterium]
MACSVVLIASAWSSSARGAPHTIEDLYRNGDIVVDHQPYPYGGGASDTAYVGGYTWQRIADDILLMESATICHINWLGYYVMDNPPATETMRIRFYGARDGDGLPDDDNIVYEESFLNPSRIATGQTVWVGVYPDEYLYEVNLSTPATLEADTPYWLEIAQIGDPETMFGWEFSLADLNGQAFINPATVDWRATSSIMADTAFQLLTVPEPSALGLVSLGMILVGKRRGRKKG